jgi:hypothetical protein
MVEVIGNYRDYILTKTIHGRMANSAKDYLHKLLFLFNVFWDSL